ncbi:MAG TPA: hypothetical protein VL625_05870 [Patescibacteria group bacterium]|nr:hypothetical protein [Patescibacteria group bacterium]
MTVEESLLAQFNFSAAYAGHAPRNARLPELADLTGSITRHAQHILFGEPHVNGNTLKTYEMLAQTPEVFIAAAANGIKHFCLEFPHTFQRHVDRYQAGEINRDDLHYYLFEDDSWHYVAMTLTGNATAQFQRDFIQCIDHAHAAGMRIHFADVAVSRDLPVPQEFVDVARSLVSRHGEEKSELPVQQYIINSYAAFPEEERQRLDKIWNDYQEARRQARMDDTAQYEFLRSRFPSGEGIMGVVGLGHLDGNADPAKSITGLLRAEGSEVAVIELYDREDAHAFIKEMYRLTDRVQNSPPDYTVIMDEHALLNADRKPAEWPTRSL